jgi:hypothetical protein
MSAIKKSILVIGESNVGKTHYGAQLLKRLIVGESKLRMAGAASNLKPFEKAMDSLAEGMATEHTPATTYIESVWPIADADGRLGSLIWPDYGGEQVINMIAERKVPGAWRDRVVSATDWVFLIRLHTLRSADDMFSRPLAALGQAHEEESQYQFSDQGRLIELLQMLLYVAELDRDTPRSSPSLTVLLTCWDELGVQGNPQSILAEQLPMLSAFIHSTWREPAIFGLSALEKALNQNGPNQDYAIHGPEQFGFVILPDSTRSEDITLPIQRLLANKEVV